MMKNLRMWRNKKAFGQKYTFLMIEIVFALLVAMLGIFGIVGYFPVGMNYQKEAMGKSYITDAAERLLRLNVGYVRNDWEWLNIFAKAKPGANDAATRWSSASLFQVNGLQVKSDINLNTNSDTNTGLFLLEHLILDKVDQSAIVRMWKDVTENHNGSKDAIIYAEVSWPAEKPYYAREKEIFSLQVSKAPEIPIASTTYSPNCSVTRDHGAGYSTTISSVVDNGDSTYTIELVVEHDGCSGSVCPELTHYSVEADENSYSDEVSFSGVSGVLDLGYTLSDDPFGGFKVDMISGIGNGTAGVFIVSYTLTALQDQEMVAHGGGNAYSASFTIADFNYVLTCTNQDSKFTATALDDEYIVDSDDDAISAIFPGSSNNYSTLAVASPGVLANDMASDGSQLSAILVTRPEKGTLALNSDGSFSYIPNSNFKGKDGFTYRAYSGSKLSNIARVKINATDPCIENSAPVWPNATFTFSEATLTEGQSFSTGIGSVNMPTDSDSDNLTITMVNGPLWLSWDGSTLSGTPDEDGSYIVDLDVFDGCKAESAQMTIVVENDFCSGNDVPEWPNPNFTFNSRTITKDKYFCWGLGSDLAKDSDSTLKFTVCDTPEGQNWLKFNSANQIAGTPTTSGTFTWTICASDGCNKASTQITLTIDDGDHSDGS